MTDAAPPADPDAPLYILDVRASKFMLIECFDAKIGAEGMTIFAGPNANGKTGALTAIESTLRGGAAIPEMPVKHGEERGETQVVLGSDGKPRYTATRVYRDGGKTSLSVTAADGSKVASPQDFLNQLTDAATFNPVRFADPRMRTAAADNAARLEMLFELCPLKINLAEHDTEAKRLFDERTAINKRAKALEAVVIDAAATGAPAGPEEDEQRLVTEIAQIENAGTIRDTAAKRVKELEAEIADVDAQIARLRARAELLVAELGKQGAVALGKSAGDVHQLKLRLAEVRERNAKRRAATADRARADERARSLLAERTAAEELTKKLADMDKLRTDAIAAAKFPVKALTIDSEGRLAINKDGKVIPFSQASKAQRVKVGFAVMASKNPKLRACLIPDGNDLDHESMADLVKIAARYKIHVFVERWLPDAAGTSIEFRDGGVVKTTPAGVAS